MQTGLDQPHFYSARQLARMRGETLAPLVQPGARVTPKPWFACVAIPQPWASLAVRGLVTKLSMDFGFEYRGRVWIYADPCDEPVLPAPLTKLVTAAYDGDVLPTGGFVGSVDVQSMAGVGMVDMSDPREHGWMIRGPLVWMLTASVEFQGEIAPRKSAVGLWWLPPHLSPEQKYQPSDPK